VAVIGVRGLLASAIDEEQVPRRPRPIGGGQLDLAYALAIHPSTGDVYVAGFTVSSPFPGTAAGAQPAFGGVADAFVARLTFARGGGASTVIVAVTSFAITAPVIASASLAMIIASDPTNRIVRPLEWGF
jgi:hypothetical protein